MIRGGSFPYFGRMPTHTKNDRGEISSWLALAAGLAMAGALAAGGLSPLIGELADDVAQSAGLEAGRPSGLSTGDPLRPIFPESPPVPVVEIPAEEPAPELIDCAARTVLDGNIVAVGADNPDMAHFDQVVIDALLSGASPATTASLAVMRDGELLYNKSYSLPGTPESTTDSVFRVASVSKTLTSTATMKLVESGAVRLDAPISTYLNLGTTADARWADITVEDLLRHRGGWDRSERGVGDPTHANGAVAAFVGKDEADLTTSDYISYISTLDMQFDPGDRMAYSNIGFLLLGQIIEEVSGQDYEDYVQQEVLQPLGIESAQVGSNTQAGSRPNEVTYIDPNWSPYSIKVEPRAAVGGWTMTAADAARFLHLVTNREADAVLSDATVDTIFADDGTGTNMGLGWFVNQGSGNMWHDGSLPGTTALTVNRPDGTTWVLLLNGRPGDTAPDNWLNDIRRELHAATNNVATWPTSDLQTTCA